MRTSGKNWKATRSAFRPTQSVTLTHSNPATASSKAFAARRLATSSLAATKAKEKELKDEKEAVRQERIKKIRERREKKEEEERFAKMEERLGRKRAERRRAREKRNKLLKS